MDGQKTFSLIRARNLSQDWNRDLFALYYPLIGAKAADLYCLLTAIAQTADQTSFAMLKTLLQAGSDAIVQKARRALERHELIRSFSEKKSGDLVRMELYPPRTFEQFFSNAFYRRLLFDRVGEEGMEQIRALYPCADRPQHLIDVSDELKVDELEAHWNDAMEEKLSRSMPQLPRAAQSDFRFDRFYPSNDARYPKRLRTEENESKIAWLAGLYGQDEEQMRKLVMKAFVTNERGHKIGIDFERISERLERGAKAAPERIRRADDYSQSPLGFLQMHQPDNAIVTKEERALLRRLASVHGFSNEVINTLIEYAMKQNDGALYVRYADTLANNLARRRVATRQDALQVLEAPFETKTKRPPYQKAPGTVPDWYSQTEVKKVSDEELEDFLNEFASLRQDTTPEEEQEEGHGTDEISV